jgi:hypothetical protein
MTNQTRNDGLWIAGIMAIAAALIGWLLYSGFFNKGSAKEEPQTVKTIVETNK